MSFLFDNNLPPPLAEALRQLSKPVTHVREIGELGPAAPDDLILDYAASWNHVVVTRDRAIPVLSNVTVAAVTGTIRGLPTEVALGPAQGLARDCVANCDNLFTIPKSSLAARRGELDPEALERLASALRIALDVD